VNLNTLREKIRASLNFKIPDAATDYETEAVTEEEGYSRILIRYADGEGDLIPAFLLLPKGAGPFPAVPVHHQHHSQWHLGKSEVCGLAGDPLQAFGPALAKKGMVVLAPDAICFEDRRTNLPGIEPDETRDWLGHFNEMSYRLVLGDTLMRKVLSDAARGVSLLWEHPMVDRGRIGTLGHSYGGSTVLFHAALDLRISFACSSGAACTYKTRMLNGTGIEMAQVIPGFAKESDIQDLVKCVAPRRICLVSAGEDKYSADADDIAALARETFAGLGVKERLQHKRFKRGHAITQERFDHIIDWLCSDFRTRTSRLPKQDDLQQPRTQS
jgi:dienelactone hydrolase